MTAAEFVSQLDKAKPANGGWKARCPAHEDGVKQSDWSLSVKQGDKGVVVKCFAGCSAEAIVARLGLEMKDLFDDEGRDVTLGQRASAALPSAIREDADSSRPSFDDRIVLAYDYTDENGELLYQSVRLREPKEFRQRRNVDGRWVWKLDDTRRVLYRLPEVVAAAEAGRAVWLPEGEKDADALAELGFAATTNPMGANAWADEYAEAFRGCPFVLIPADCDESGRKAAHEKARSITGAGIKAKVIDLAPERDDGFDVTDYIAEHGDEEATRLLRELGKTTPAWTPNSDPGTTPKPHIVSVESFLGDVPPYDETKDYLGPFLHGGYRVHVAGPIGHGKTTFLMESVSAALLGEPFLGWKGQGDLRALYIDLEMPAELLAQAIRDARLDRAEGFHLMHLPDGLEVDVNAQHRRMLEHAVEGFHIVVIDPWYKLLGNELEYSSGRGVIALLDGIRARHPEICTLVGFHAQEPLAPNDPVVLGNVSGFKFFQRPADIVCTFQRMEGDVSRLRWEKNRSPRLNVKKGDSWQLRWERGRGFAREQGDGVAADQLGFAEAA